MLAFFFYVVLHFRRLLFILYVCTESLALVSDPTSRRFIRLLLFQTFIYIYMQTLINQLKEYDRYLDWLAYQYIPSTTLSYLFYSKIMNSLYMYL